MMMSSVFIAKHCKATGTAIRMSGNPRERGAVACTYSCMHIQLEHTHGRTPAFDLERESESESESFTASAP